MKKIVKEFISFINKGNFLEIAVGLLLAATFKDVITSFSNTFIMPIINKLLGSINYANVYFDIAGMRFEYGSFMTTLISFIITGFILFVIVKTYNKMINKQEEELSENELSILKEIRDEIKKR
ncbi:MAG: large conductance mechanosensitive channel protein MscL, partial [Bacilli bacterium]|jgi:large conductance mechanosensitive channel|nr:large conductance mechanosensitive channel protein MscL [Bacilli bacterium]